MAGRFVLSTILLLAALVLLALKFGLRARLREFARAIDGIVNLLLALIIGGYVIQLLFMLWKD